MWDLYLSYENELQNTQLFDPMAEIYNQVPDPKPIQPGQPIAPPIVLIGSFARISDKLAIVESARRSSVYKRTLRLVVVDVAQQGVPVVRTEMLAQEWDHSTAPVQAPSA
jgi:hypothetical protein